MKLKSIFYSAWANLRANFARSVFSVLGIVIGTASVIIVVAIINGKREASLKEISAGREGTLFVKSLDGREGLNLGHVDQVGDIPGVFSAYPVIAGSVQAKGTRGGRRFNLLGADSHYVTVFNVTIATGRYFLPEEASSRPRICLLSEWAANRAFGFEYPIGQRLRLAGGSLEVVGVFKSEERLKRMGQDPHVIVPILTAMHLLNVAAFDEIQVRAKTNHLDKVKAELTSLFSSVTEGKARFEIQDPRDDMKEINAEARRWMLQLALLAGISLFVGGIGLMNVMLTTVAERMQEIGVRKAVGADPRSILWQFLIESAILSALGGCLGVGAGVLATYSVFVFTKGQVLISILPLSILVSFAFSIVIGVVFGLLPASKASRLSPVEALRYE